MFFIQKNSTDRRQRTLAINAYNESYSSRVEIKENCYYSVCIFGVHVQWNPVNMNTIGQKNVVVLTGWSY